MSKADTFAAKRILPVGEWLAENAYIVPGAHRLSTATGLLVGLATGSQMMDLLTGQDFRGNHIDKNKYPEALRPYYGLMAYNHYDDSPDAKWHRVADAFIPFVFGAVGAMSGSTLYMLGKMNPVMTGIRAESAKIADGGLHTLQYADAVANQQHARNLNWIAGPNYGGGSTLGNHVLPNPLSQVLGAFRFQFGANKDAIPPFFQKEIFGNYGSGSKKPFTHLKSMISWVENNLAHFAGESEWYKEHDQLLKHAKDSLKFFKDRVRPEDITKMEKYIEERIIELSEAMQKIESETGLSGEELISELRNTKTNYQSVKDFQKDIQSAFWGDGLYAQWKEMGLLDLNDPESVRKAAELIGDNGVLSTIMRWLPGGGDVSAAQQAFIDAHTKGAQASVASAKLPNLRDFTPGFLATTGLGLGGAAAIGGSGVASYRNHKDQHQAMQDRATYNGKAGNLSSSGDSDSQSHAPERSLSRHEAAKQDHIKHKQQRDQGGVMGIVNGPVVNFMHWASNMVVVPPGKHRFMNAAFMAAFLFGGAKVSEAMFGRTIRGAVLKEKDVNFLLKPIFNKLPYVWQSGKIQDRWRFVGHQLLPVAIGALGTYTGSRMYFHDRIEETKKAEFLEDYTDKIVMDESEAYAKASAAVSILNTGSGFHAFPFINYGVNLQNRFLMGMGQQVATPGLGKWWSANPSLYPWHVKRLLNNMVEYTLHNPDQYPEQLEPMCNALIAKLYPDLSKDQVLQKQDILVDKVYAIRDKYWQDGGIPEEQKSVAKIELERHFRRQGLEQTLMEAGLNPLDAAIDNNGASGALAKAFGSRHEVQEDVKAYHKKARERVSKIEKRLQKQHEQEQPPTIIKDPSMNVASRERLTFPESKQIH